MAYKLNVSYYGQRRNWSCWTSDTKDCENGNITKADSQYKKTASMDHWVDKYRPKHKSELIGNEKAVAEIEQWLQVFKQPSQVTKSFRNGLLISGPPGIGKTSAAHVLLKQYGFDVIEFNASELRTSKEIGEKLDGILSGQSVTKMFVKSTVTSVIMDEFDGIEAKKEYGAGDLVDYLQYSELQYQKLVKQETRKKIDPKKSDEWKARRCFNGYWVNRNPIVCICNQVNKNVTPLLKYCVHVEFTRPSDNDIYILLDRICQAEQIPLSSACLRLMAPICQGDHRRSVYLLDQAHLHQKTLGTKKMTNTEWFQFFQQLGTKDIDMELMDGVSRVFNDYDLTVSQVLSMYEIDTNFLPCLLHENFIRFVDEKVIETYDQKVTTCLEYYDAVLDSQLFRSDMFGNWDMTDYVGFYSAVVPNRILSNKKQRSAKYHLDKSALISKYNYRFYNLKSINRISRKLRLDLSQFPFLSLLGTYAIFEADETVAMSILTFFASYSLMFTEFEKTMKLSPLFHSFERLWTKKQQKTWGKKYEVFHVPEEDSEI